MIRSAIALAILGQASAVVAGHCTERSPVVGHQHCGAFGSRWAHAVWSDLIFQPALVLERTALSSGTASGTAYTTTSSSAYGLRLAPGSDLHPIAYGGRFRFGYHGPYLTAAVEMTVGFFGHPTVVTTLGSGPMATSSGGDLLDAAAVVGAHRRWDRITLGAEIAVGERTIWLQGGFPDGYTACPGGANGRDCNVGVITDRRLLIEPAASVELWLNRQITLVATAGLDVSGGGETLAIGLAGHLEPFDGD